MANYHKTKWEKEVLPTIKSICTSCKKSCSGKYPVTGCGSFVKK